MSNENAKKFLDDVNNDASLQEKLLDAASSAQSWVTEAASKGYEMTVEELRTAAEALIGKPITGESLIGELRSLFGGELGDESLDAVTGGAGVPARQLQVSTVKAGSAQTGPAGIASTHVKEGGPIKVGGFNPGGNQSTPGG